MSKVYTRFDLPKARATESGDRMRDTYKWSINDKGDKELMHDANLDRQAEIESYADECDIKNIVARAAFDPAFAQSLAQGSTGEYADTTEYPENIHELKKMADKAGKTIEEINEQLKQKQTEQPKEAEVKNENEPE